MCSGMRRNVQKSRYKIQSCDLIVKKFDPDKCPTNLCRFGADEKSAIGIKTERDILIASHT
jgi:hypothetical protein